MYEIHKTYFMHNPILKNRKYGCMYEFSARSINVSKWKSDRQEQKVPVHSVLSGTQLIIKEYTFKV